MRKIFPAVVLSLLLAVNASTDNKKEADRVKNSGLVMKEILNIPEGAPQELLDKAYCTPVGRKGRVYRQARGVRRQ